MVEPDIGKLGLDRDHPAFVDAARLAGTRIGGARVRRPFVVPV